MVKTVICGKMVCPGVAWWIFFSFAYSLEEVDLEMHGLVGSDWSELNY